ncbi:hypothetical protein ARAM_006267 [Aspergillus rambellii]|uniref:Uncharacterized protein n=1 Tax=Aspergillus rambellii TaxID=308745 RepID=A0A0F8URZ2_9EURO|nr:hypothetical protein ARAM_006267 [Aspergillus rambellii]
MTPSPTPGAEVAAANHRTKEENQERAFIAASRRKDRSLDARIESANRASALHKQRTGRALHISREIVESEAMYEEIDCNYQAKLQRMMHAQTLQLEQDFNRKLLDAMRNNQPGLQQRRASSLTPRGPLHGARKMSLDLSRLRSSISEGMNNSGSPLSSPLAAGVLPNSNVLLSPNHSHFSPSYSLAPGSNGQMSSYVTQATPGAPTWLGGGGGGGGPQHLWEGFYSPSPLSGARGGMPMPMRPFRDRLGSCPTIPHGMPTATPTPMAAPIVPAGARGPVAMSQHVRVRSEPGQMAAAAPLSAATMPHSSADAASLTTPTTTGMSSPTHDLSSSTEFLPTPDLCPTPVTPTSPTTSNLHHFQHTGTSVDLSALDLGAEKWNTDFLHDFDLDPQLSSELTSMFPRGPTDPEYLDFSQFASTLDNNTQVQFGPEGTATAAGMDDMTGMEEFTISA